MAAGKPHIYLLPLLFIGGIFCFSAPIYPPPLSAGQYAVGNCRTPTKDQKLRVSAEGRSDTLIEERFQPP
jgi:hypothetical protein